MIDLSLVLASFLLTLLLHSTLLLGGAALLDRALRPRATALRETIWRAALVGALLSASVATFVPYGRFTLLERLPLAAGNHFAAAEPVAANRPPASEDTATENSGSESAPLLAANAGNRELPLSAGVLPALSPASVAPGEPGLLRSLSSRLPGRWPETLVTIWAAGALLALLRLAVLAFLARHELRLRAPVEREFAAELETLADERQVALPTLSVAPALAGPVSLPNREIVLPPWVLSALAPGQRRALLAHELAHQARRDPLWIVLALLLEALLWPQPLVRLARRRLTRLAELEADAWAARAVSDPRALAECLTECAAHLVAGRAALFGAAFATGPANESPLLDRIERLLEGEAMNRPRPSRLLRLSVTALLAGTALLLPGCDIDDLRAEMGGSSTNITISNNGDEMKVSVSHPGYRLKLRSEGKVTFNDTESDLATLAPGAEFRIAETLAGVDRVLEVSSGANGALERSYSVDGANKPFDDAARAWLAEALPRMFRESGFDAEARVQRLLKRGGPELVLSEVELCNGDWAKSTYLGTLLGAAQLTPPEVDRAIAAIRGIESDYYVRQALDHALKSQTVDGDRFVKLLEVASKIDSDYELSEFLIAVAAKLPDDATARAAWIAAARTIDSDYERGRSIAAAFDRGTGDAGFTAELIALAAEKSGSDYELRQTLSRVGELGAEPAVAAAYVAATRKLDSAFERSQALVALLERPSLDDAAVAGVLESAAEIDSSFEKTSVLQAAATRVATDAELSRRYREIARQLGEFERGQALRALDDAAPR